MSHKHKVNKNIEVEDESEIFGDVDVCFYDKEMLDNLMSAFSAISSSVYTHSMSGTFSNLQGFSYYNKILYPKIQELDEHQKPDWYSKDYLIDGLLVIHGFYNFMENHNGNSNKSYKYLKEVFERFRCRYVTWEDSVK